MICGIQGEPEDLRPGARQEPSEKYQILTKEILNKFLS